MSDPRHTKSGFATRAIHHGYDPQSHNGALNPPVYMSSTFAFETAEQGGRMFAGEEQGFIYSRIANPGKIRDQTYPCRSDRSEGT